MLKYTFYIFIFASTILGLNSPIGRNTIAVYWGQNGLLRPGAQQPLSFYCEVSFLRSLDDQAINLADSIDNCQPINGTDLVYCPQMEEDIIRCQKTFGKTVLLSIGGAAYNESGFSTEQSANNAAVKVWENFGPITNDTTAIRPFGKAVVDGFDFDFESPKSNMHPFGTRLRSLMDMYMKSNDRKFLLTAAPQCPFPEINFGPLLNGSIYYDAIWVQFYNNFCGADSFLPGNSTQHDYNIGTWNKWAKDTYPGKDVKILIGIPASKNASTTGYISDETLTTVIQYSSNFTNFGGVMVWEMTTLFQNKGYLKTIAAAMNRKAPTYLNLDSPSIISSTSSFNQTSSASHLITESDASAISRTTNISWLYYTSIFFNIMFLI